LRRGNDHFEWFYKEIPKDSETRFRLFKQKFEDRRITRTDFAKRMGSSRSAVNRLLDGNADSVTLKTLVKAAAALGMEITFGLSERASMAKNDGKDRNVAARA
jgi:transcriptional regulator with XRE-family HTH domain